MNEWKNKHVFISGGAGVIGNALVEQLLQLGAKLFVGDLKPQPDTWPSIQYRQGDLISLTPEEIEAFKPEIFFHLAATFERSIETSSFWEENYHHNIALSHHILSVIKDNPSLKKIIFASSYLIYNPRQYLFSKAQKTANPIREQAEISPRNLCGMAKLLHEKELSFIKEFRPELQTTSARIFRSYGKDSRDIISRWIQAIFNKEPITIYRPEGLFDYVYANDVAKGLILLSESSFSGVVNLGSGRARSVNEVINILKDRLGNFSHQIIPSDIPFEASEADMHLYHSLTNHQHSFKPLEDTIPDLITYYKI